MWVMGCGQKVRLSTEVILGSVIQLGAPSSAVTSQFLNPLILLITRNCSTYEITESNIPLSDMISFPYGLFAQAGLLPLF